MTSNFKVEFLDKYLGSLAGAIIGDALGWPQEDRGKKVGKHAYPQAQFQKWTKKSGFGNLTYYEEITPGSYSDDSQLLFATARSLQHANWFSHFVRVELPTWLVYERGGGGATKRSANLWSNGKPPWKFDSQKKSDIEKYFKAGGNGVTMRILPHVFNCHSNENLDELSQQVLLNGIATHGHPRALLSAILYAWALQYQVNKEDTLGYGELVAYLLEEKKHWMKFPSLNNLDDWKEAADLFTNGNYMDIWEETGKELVDGLMIIKEALDRGLMDKTDYTLTKLNCFNPKIRGAGTVASLISIYIASKYASDPVTGLLEVSFLKNSDADTNASMVGGLLGTIHGTEWIIPDWYLVQDYEYMRNIVNTLSTKKADLTPKLWHWTEKNKFKDTLDIIKIGDERVLSVFGNIKLIDKIKHKPMSVNINPITYQFLSDQGQTIYINITKKNESIYTPPVNKHSVNLNRKISLELNEIEKLIAIMPSRVTTKKTLAIISEILKGIDSIDINNRKEIENFANQFVQKGYEMNLIMELISLIVKSNKIN
ncbi:ADP-ribosylglycohydrolase family protein [Bacillus cereus]|uniref:ADP-ribosylglycohydrolase family protein n=1 Tax=Bacillus cereus TaxID=1396 RepID=UPI0023E4027C|nr:ADP-ribosylglycohydrolase family protein [Bacillus cereus]MDF3555395.1 ADP-ribosylglycohydrolase family protein [Bacillus cereus]